MVQTEQLPASKSRWGLSNNQLKMVAMVTMLLDHVGKAILPKWTILQILGRLSFPIFAYMIAEGCVHTKHKLRYFLHLAILALGCQLVYFFVMGSLYLSVLVTFSVSMLVIFSIDAFRKRKRPLRFLLMLVVAAGAVFLAEIAPRMFAGSGLVLDYGLYGVLFPVVIYCMPGKYTKLMGAAVLLVCKGFLSGGIHWFGLLTLPLLFLYNGKRGKYKMKYVFYVFYPVHLGLIYLVQVLLQWLQTQG